MAHDMFPGDRVKVLKGRYMGMKGTLLQTVFLGSRGMICDVELIMENYGGKVIAKLAAKSLELVEPPKLEELKCKRMLFIVKEDIK